MFGYGAWPGKDTFRGRKRDEEPNMKRQNKGKTETDGGKTERGEGRKMRREDAEKYAHTV